MHAQKCMHTTCTAQAQNALLNPPTWNNRHLFHYLNILLFFSSSGSHLYKNVTLKSSHNGHKNAAGSRKLDTLLRGAAWAHLLMCAEDEACYYRQLFAQLLLTHTSICTQAVKRKGTLRGVREFAHPPSPKSWYWKIHEQRAKLQL